MVIPPKRKLPAPPVSAALGMAVAYYAYPAFSVLNIGSRMAALILFFVFFIFTVIISFFRVLRFPFSEASSRVSKLSILVTAAAVGFSLGIASRLNVTSQVQMGLPNESVAAISGVLLDDPRSLNGGSGLGALMLRECGAGGGLRASARGNITVFFPAESIPRLREFGRGCEIYVEGRLSSGSMGVLFNASSVHIMKPAPAPEQFRTALRMTLLDRFRSHWQSHWQSSGQSQGQNPPVWGALASALLLGMRDDLNVDLSAEFRNSGCAHILALSGMHLAILSGVLAFLLRRPLGIRWATVAGAAFVVFYVFVAGSQPSLVRAAIMYLIAAFALWGFLKGEPFSLLCMAFIIQLLFQSNSGISISFILSYLALTGILTMGGTFQSLFRGRLPPVISGSLSASLGAFIVTAPVVVFFFGSLRPIGIIAGLAVVPISSLFIVLSLAALAASFIPVPLFAVFDFILTLVYRLMEFIVTLAGKVPGFSSSTPLPALVFSILFWLILLFVHRRDISYRNRIAPLD